MDPVAPEQTQAARKRRVVSQITIIGIARMGTLSAVYSQSKPTARVSVMPNAHLLSVLKVAGYTSNASAGGKTSGSLWSLIIAAHWIVRHTRQSFEIDKFYGRRRQDTTHFPVGSLKQREEFIKSWCI
jgi:hypothetical protein